MKHILDRHRVNWPHIDGLPVHQERIQRVITELDGVVIKYEKAWGVDRLPKLVDDATYQKWQLQMEKLNTALQQSDEVLVNDLAAGCIRGLQVMEAQAVEAGHKPPTKPEAWLCRMGSRTLAIVATEDDAAIYQAHSDIADNVVIWPITAIARIVGEQYQNWDNQLSKLGMPDKAVMHTKAEDFNDELPF